MITNDVSDYINLLVRIAHIIYNHPLFVKLYRLWSSSLCSLLKPPPPLRSKYYLQQPVLKHCQSVLPKVWKSNFHTNTRTGKNYGFI